MRFNNLQEINIKDNLLFAPPPEVESEEAAHTVALGNHRASVS